jgi:hypothetical protein
MVGACVAAFCAEVISMPVLGAALGVYANGDTKSVPVSTVAGALDTAVTFAGEDTEVVSVAPAGLLSAIVAARPALAS